jgi:anti-sigma factor RsiW
VSELEMELAGHLKPVTAPEGLWERIQTPAAPKRVDRSDWGSWAIAAALLLLAGGSLVWQIGQSGDSVAAMKQLRSGKVDFRSDNAVEIRTWLKAQTGIDVELPAERSGRVRLIGARVIPNNGAAIAAVCYTADDGGATLLVSKASQSQPPKHSFSRGAGVSTWSMRGQVYTLASTAKDPQAACLLCHLRPS